MKRFLIPMMGLMVGACALGEEPENAAAEGPRYVDEAPLPEGWPAPGPYDEVAEKSYPAYRAAFTTDRGQTRSFWTLFLHIQRNDIPMTAPVEMSVEPGEPSLARRGMAFLYQNPEVGREGADGAAVEVRDVAPAKALSYAWQGRDSEENVARAKAALDEALAERGVEAKSFRLLGYNGPSTPRDRATWELQALLD